MKKDKVVQIIIILLIFLSTISIIQKPEQSDTLFSIAVGDRISKYGFEEEDQLVWHDGLKYIYLRWGFDVIVDKIYDSFGFDGIQVFIVIISVAQTLGYYFILSHFTKKKIFSFICTMIILNPLAAEFVGRAHIISFLLFLIEYYCIEKLVETNKNRYVVALTIIPLLLVNFHTSTYPLYFMFYLPYIAEWILSKLNLKSDDSSKIIIEKRNIKKLITLVVLGVFFGLCSPSGIDAYKYVFKVMGAISAEIIAEMQSVNILDSGIIAIGISLFVGIIAFTKTKVRIVDCFLVLGITIMSLNTVRYTFFFYLIASICIFRLLNNLLDNYEVDFNFVNKKIKTGLFIFVIIVITLMSAQNLIQNSSGDYINAKDYPIAATQYIINNLDISQMRIYNHFNFGGYLELMGIPVFLDARAEMFLEEFNNTSVLYDWNTVLNMKEHYSKVFDKYEITHALLYTKEAINNYIIDDPEWNIIYQDDTFVLYERVKN